MTTSDDILRHTLGLDISPRPYRNRYYAPEGTDNRPLCDSMVASGLLTYDGTTFHATDAGKAMVLPRRVPLVGRYAKTSTHWTGAWTEHTVFIGRMRITYSNHGKQNVMGRFGGGWNWHLGLQWGRNSAILFCLVFMIIINWKKVD